MEAVKRTKQDPSWLTQACGKGVKMVLAVALRPAAGRTVPITFMERHIEEVLASQRKMLGRLHQDPGRDDEMRRFSSGCTWKNWRNWLSRQSHIAVSPVSYNKLLAEPAIEAGRVNRFLDGEARCGENGERGGPVAV